MARFPYIEVPECIKCAYPSGDWFRECCKCLSLQWLDPDPGKWKCTGCGHKFCARVEDGEESMDFEKEDTTAGGMMGCRVFVYKVWD